MPKDHLRSLSPLSESERYQLARLLDRSGQSLEAAESQRAKERAEEDRERARQEKRVALEKKLSSRLAALRLDIDRATAALYEKAESGVAFRHVAGKLQEFGELVPRLSYFNTAADNLDYDQLLLLGELALEMYQASVRPKIGRTLREKMQSVAIDVGQDVPGAGGPTDDRTVLAQKIIEAGKRRRGEST